MDRRGVRKHLALSRRGFLIRRIARVNLGNRGKSSEPGSRAEIPSIDVLNFQTQKLKTHTFVERDRGGVEQRLRHSIAFIERS